MKILLTGVTGLVGGETAGQLLKEGHELFCLVRSQNHKTELSGQITFIEGHLDKHSFEWVQKLPNDLDGVIHIAGLVHTHLEEEFYQVNSEGTLKLIKALKLRYETTPLRFTLISSLAAHGPSKPLVLKGTTEEEGEDLPVSAYGKSKLLAEKHLKKEAPSCWITSIVRPPMVIGPHDRAFIDVFKMVKKGILLIPGSKGDLKRYSFVAVYDLATFIIKAFMAQGHKPHELFYVAYPKTITYRELYEAVASTMKLPKLKEITLPVFFLRFGAIFCSALAQTFPKNRHCQKIRLTKDKYHEIKASSWVCSAEKGKKLLSMNYEWDLKRILEVTYQSYKDLL